jgi:hypothetical protein
MTFGDADVILRFAVKLDAPELTVIAAVCVVSVV